MLVKVWAIHYRCHRHHISTFQKYLKDYMEIIPILINMLKPSQTGTISYLCIPRTLDSARHKLGIYLFWSRWVHEWFCPAAIFVLYIAGDTNHQGLNIFLFCCNDIVCVQNTPKLCYFIFNARYYTWKIKSVTLKFIWI